ncbi:MAG: hypothetical protein ABIK92_18140 [Pseudomonadota bacterium]
MAKYFCAKSVSLEKIEMILKNELGSIYNFKIKKNRVYIAENWFIGCVLKYKCKNAVTIYIGPYMPFWLRLLLLIVVFAIFSGILTAITGYFTPVSGGVIPLLIFVLLVRLPSYGLRQKIGLIIPNFA